MQSKHTLPVPNHSSISSILARPYYRRHSHRKPPSLLALLFVDTRGRPEMKDGFLQSVRPEMRCHEQEQEDIRTSSYRRLSNRSAPFIPPPEGECGAATVVSGHVSGGRRPFDSGGERDTLTFNCEEDLRACLMVRMGPPSPLGRRNEREQIQIQIRP